MTHIVKHQQCFVNMASLGKCFFFYTTAQLELPHCVHPLNLCHLQSAPALNTSHQSQSVSEKDGERRLSPRRRAPFKRSHDPTARGTLAGSHTPHTNRVGVKGDRRPSCRECAHFAFAVGKSWSKVDRQQLPATYLSAA